MMPLPVTIVSGFLGAGKTTLINQLLCEDHGLRLMVVVNDFGAINIDADLLHSAEEDTIALTNGCVCCNMGDDLTKALDTALDRAPRPDHVIIEASGIADPTAIANTVIAERELSYAGILTLVDGLNLPTQLTNPEIADQVKHQITYGDLVLVSKSEDIPEELTDLTSRPAHLVKDLPLAPLLMEIIPFPKGRAIAPHPAYTAWQFQSETPMSRAQLGGKLAARPNGLYRLKGLILTDDGGYEVHIVGSYVSARRAPTKKTRLVGLGPASQITREEIAHWWSA